MKVAKEIRQGTSRDWELFMVDGREWITKLRSETRYEIIWQFEPDVNSYYFNYSSILLELCLYEYIPWNYSTFRVACNRRIKRTLTLWGMQIVRIPRPPKNRRKKPYRKSSKNVLFRHDDRRVRLYTCAVFYCRRLHLNSENNLKLLCETRITTYLVTGFSARSTRTHAN